MLLCPPPKKNEAALPEKGRLALGECVDLLPVQFFFLREHGQVAIGQ